MIVWLVNLKFWLVIKIINLPSDENRTEKKFQFFSFIKRNWYCIQGLRISMIFVNNFIACINNIIWIFEFYREIALEILQQEEIGSFIVRDSSTHPGCYALSVRVPKFENPTGISHYLILKTQRGVKLKVINCRHLLPWSLNEKFYVLHQTCAFITLQFIFFSQ